MHKVMNGLAPMLGGGLLATVGLRRRSAVGLLMAAAGGWLAYRGYRMATCNAGEPGCEPDKEKCRVLLDTLGAGVTAGIYDQVSQQAKEERTAAGDSIDDPVLEASDDSFPCSDPPSFSPRTEAGALV
ncbi:hypothetical protein J0H58_19360 [bacterium]|nr:hypothetical protein [bacterium]